MELARRGVNVVLISRNVDKLNELAREVGKFILLVKCHLSYLTIEIEIPHR